MDKLTFGFAMCGSFCTFDTAVAALRAVKEQYETVIPIMSETSFHTDSRFGPAEKFITQIEQICGQKIRKSIPEVEPFGPKKLLDALIIAPCTGNTISKLANGIADTAVTLACKSHLRNARPVILAVSTNDALGANAKNIGNLMARKQFYFVPFGQDSYTEKPNSMVADMDQIVPTVEAALQGRQLQPVLLPSRP